MVFFCLKDQEKALGNVYFFLDCLKGLSYNISTIALYQEKETSMRVYRQGDVLLRECVGETASMHPQLKEIPRQNGKVVLALGESTGHMHAFGQSKIKMFAETGDGRGLTGFGNSGLFRGRADNQRSLVHGTESDPLQAPQLRRFIEVDEEVGLLEHDEHETIQVGKGFYEVIIQREYTPERIRRVED